MLLSIILPVYNEEGSIEYVINDIHKNILTKIKPSELIIVEDGSTDNTKNIIRRLSRKFKFKALLRPNKKNYADAILTGLKHAKGNYVLTLDADGQYSAESFWDLWNSKTNFDVITGCRIKRQDSFYRKLISACYKFLTRFLFWCPNFRDLTSPLRLFKKKVARVILRDFKYARYSFWGEFTLRSWRNGFSELEIFVVHKKRIEGTTRVYSIEKLPHIILHHIMFLLKLRWEFWFGRSMK